MKRIFILISIPLFFYSCLVDVVDTDKPTYVDALSIEDHLKGIDLSKYSLITDTVNFPVLGWEGVSNKHLKIDQFKDAKDAGLTLSLGGFANADSLAKALDLAQEVGIRVFIWTPELRTKTEETVKRFMNHPANAGYFLQDEPSTASIPELKKLASRIESIDNSRFCYINLLPNYVQPSHFGATNYEEYVNRFIKEIPLKVISFDHYPVVGNGNHINYSWYANLELIRNESIKSNIPFWAFVLSSAHLDYPIPTLAHLRLQVYSNLAYGAKAIQYFTYRIPNKDLYISAPIDRNGNKTDEYYLIRKMNEEIHSLSYVFLTSHVTNISHYGGARFQGTKEYFSPPLSIKSLRISGGNALISEMENSSNKFLMIQNNNLLNEISIKIEANNSVKMILKNGTIIPLTLIKEEFKLTPGDMVIFMD